ncbi:MAG TPA: hypothetical protein VF273_08540 [Pelobium sp.]
MNNTYLKPIYTLAFMLMCVVCVNAQKLPDIQEQNLRISKIKVDGNSADWSFPLKAFNKSTGLNYSIANDDQKLYIIIQANDKNTTRKILMGGITFSINEDGKKRSEDLLTLTYPVVTQRSRRSAMGGGQRGFGAYQTMTEEQKDSLQHSFIQKQLETAKDIKIAGFKNVTDTLVSIYNEYSIKAAASFDNSGTYTYEIGIPLKLLPINTDKEFGYKLKINGLEMRNFGRMGGENRRNEGGGGGFQNRTGGGGRNSVDFQDLMSPTFLTGKYSLAK